MLGLDVVKVGTGWFVTGWAVDTDVPSRGGAGATPSEDVAGAVAVTMEMSDSDVVGAVKMTLLLGLAVDEVDGLISILLALLTSSLTMFGMLSDGSALHRGDIDVVSAVLHLLMTVSLAGASGSGLTINPKLVMLA